MYANKHFFFVRKQHFSFGVAFGAHPILCPQRCLFMISGKCGFLSMLVRSNKSLKTPENPCIRICHQYQHHCHPPHHDDDHLALVGSIKRGQAVRCHAKP